MSVVLYNEPWMKISTILTILGFILFVALLKYLSSRFFSSSAEKIKAKYHYERKNYLMTVAERDFYGMLTQILGTDYLVFPQVHMSAILGHKVKGQNWKAAFRHVNQKSVDYVICDNANLIPLIAVELDDRSHDADDRRARDIEVERILSEAGFPLLRFTHNQDMGFVKDQILEKLSQSAQN